MSFLALFTVVAITSMDCNDIGHDIGYGICQAKMLCDGNFVETKGHGVMMVQKHACY